MTTPQSETITRDTYLAEANAELDAILGEVDEVDPPPAPESDRRWLRLIVVVLLAAAVFAIGLVLLRGRRPARMALNLVR